MDATLNLVSTGNALCVKYGFTPKISPLSNWPSEDVKFIEAEEVKEMAKFIIGRWRTDLQNVNIAYLFKSKASKSGSNVTFGSAKTESELQRVLHSFDGIIQIGYDTWKELELDQKVRLIDHELQHLIIDPEKGKLAIATHPVEEFPDIIQRWGPGKDADIQYINAYQSFSKAHGSLVPTV